MSSLQVTDQRTIIFLAMPCTPAILRQRLAPSALLLVVALLFAQWLGLAHRIEHVRPAQLAPHAAAVAQADTAGYDKSLEHSCALFDATTLANILHSPAVSLPVLPGAQILALWVAFASWDAPVLLHFSSRAPPLA